MMESAKTKVQQEANASNSPIAKMLSNQICDMIINEERATKVLVEAKTLMECKKCLDDFARKIKTGNESCVSQADAEKIIFSYYDFQDIDKSLKQENKVVNILDLI